MRIPVIILCAFYTMALRAQSVPVSPEERIADFQALPTNGGFRFTPMVPPLRQIAGAPTAFYDYYWEFGDGSFRFEEAPTHAYSLPGEYEVQLLATGKYDNGAAPRSRKKKVVRDTTVVIASTTPSVAPDVLENEWDALGMKAVRDARPGEELVCILSYHNNLPVPQSGRIYLFYNEKTFDKNHFQFGEARTHYGEEALPDAAGLSWHLPARHLPSDYWATTSENIFFQQLAVPEADGETLLANSRARYRESRGWRFQGMNPGEVRNLFISLHPTPDMLADTNAIITLQGIYLTDDGQIADPFTLELEIVASHDPNRISVSNPRMGFRGVRSKSLTYKVQFQNTGEGPASKVEITCDVPQGLHAGKLEILDQYPQCPICPEGQITFSCLDTTFLDGQLVFTFRNIYLPGTRQEGVNDRDSTKGFVKYRLKPERRIKKVSMQSQASIVFDQNEPIRTNSARTHFKPGLSPGLIVSRNFIPGDGAGSYYSVGATLSPFKPYRKYLQAELHLGFNRQMNEALPPSVDSLSDVREIFTGGAFFAAVVDSLTRVQEDRNIDTYSVELVPISLRHNLTNYVGLGIGSIIQLDFSEIVENTLQQTATRVYNCPEPDPTIPRRQCRFIQDLSSNKRLENRQTRSETNLHFKLFADVQFGLVRRGPMLGFRGILPLQQNADAYYAVYLNFKL